VIAVDSHARNSRTHWRPRGELGRLVLKQQKADWNTVKKHVPDAINEITAADPGMMTLLFKFVSQTYLH